MNKTNTKTVINYIKNFINEQSIDAYIVPHGDPHMLEYCPAHHKRLQFISNFDGSAGMAIIANDKSKASIFVDGRYTLQAKQQVDSQLFDVNNYTIKDIVRWISIKSNKKRKVGYDPRLINCAMVDKLSQHHCIDMIPIEHNPIDEIWKDQPPLPNYPIEIYDEKYAGLSADKKIEKIISTLLMKRVDYFIETSLDCICWILNIRGRDIEQIPIVIAYLIIDTKRHKILLFVDPKKITKEIPTYFNNLDTLIEINNYHDIINHIKKLSGNIAIDHTLCPDFIRKTVKRNHNNNNLIDIKSPIMQEKAQKNATEIQGMRDAHIKDGIAMCHFLYWLDEQINNGALLSEIAISQKVTQFRSQQPGYITNSFEPIVGFGSNGAIIHYHPTDKSNKVIDCNHDNGLLLIDSGGQYINGTTDITRVIPIGKITKEQKRCFTVVLKAHIALATAKFPKGTTGVRLDAIARYPLWTHGMDYAHGTGHGVGAFLDVHEGPQSISTGGTASLTPLESGMICSNEPGYYKKGEFGIRIENIILIKETDKTVASNNNNNNKNNNNKKKKNFLEAETISLAPIDKRLVDKSTLDKREIDWLNSYHKEVMAKLSPHIKDKKVMGWLQEVCCPI